MRARPARDSSGYGCIKLTDFGLTGSFSTKLEGDPWTQGELGGENRLGARIGGTEEYRSPEQRWLLSELENKAADAAAFNRLRDEWRITPAISDLWAASMVVLEMHAREPPRSRSWRAIANAKDAVDARGERKTAREVREYDPEEAEQWVVKELGLSAYLGKIKARKLGGAELLKNWASARWHRETLRVDAPAASCASGGARCCARSRPRSTRCRTTSRTCCARSSRRRSTTG